uniref:Uncharacterized protein n=1 Tax=Solanum tuberosum TaxID=4113 RepID=M1D8C4_SOLTU
MGGPTGYSGLPWVVVCKSSFGTLIHEAISEAWSPLLGVGALVDALHWAEFSVVFRVFFKDPGQDHNHSYEPSRPSRAIKWPRVEEANLGSLGGLSTSPP